MVERTVERVISHLPVVLARPLYGMSIDRSSVMQQTLHKSVGRRSRAARTPRPPRVPALSTRGCGDRSTATGSAPRAQGALACRGCEEIRGGAPLRGRA